MADNKIDPLLRDELTAILIEEMAVSQTDEQATNKPARHLDDITREAQACLLAAEEALLAYYADDSRAVRLHRVGHASALVQAAATVLRSIEGEVAGHG